jgi:ADP-ribosyl-[dinitrogen reductase] hydrolase
MLGAIIGDIVGSVFEFNNIKTKDFPLFSADSTFTDDTVCTIAVAEAILDCLDIAATLQKWCRRYPSMSYGAAFQRWIASPNPKPYNSWGNGAAMRVSPAAFLATSLEQARFLTIQVTEVTHNHPEGLKGALATTDAIWLFREHADVETVRHHITSTYGYHLSRTVDAIRPHYRFNESCQGTVPESVICALEGRDFEDVIRNAISIGGDSDTVAAIAGAVAEARFGIDALQTYITEVINRLPDDILSVLKRLYPLMRLA